MGFTALEHKTQSVDQCVPGCHWTKPCPMGMECSMGSQYPGYAILFSNKMFLISYLFRYIFLNF